MSYKPSKNIFLLGLTSLFNDLSSEMVFSVFPAFFISVLKSGAGALGLVDGIAEGASNIIKIYSGQLSDKIQKRKPFIVFGYALSVITRPLFVLVSSVGGALGLRITDRVGKGFRDSPRDAVISLSTSKEEMGRAFGFHRAFDTIGAILGPLVAYLILRAYPNGFHVVFITAFFIGILGVLTVSFIKDVVGEVQKKNISFSSLALFSGGFKRYLIALLFLSLGTMPVTVLLLKTQNIGLTLADIPLFYLLYNISYAGFSFFAGKTSDKIGTKKVIVAGYLLLVAGYVVISFAESVAVLIVAFLILGLFPALTDGVQRALASELSPQELRGSALGYVNAISGLGLLFAGITGGFLWQQFNIAYALSLAGVLTILGIMILLTVGSSKG